ncbi:MAG: radical SAM protein [Bacteroidales bacterium]|nr:radical SAM protein [Bacteroidales bacterium]
MSTIRKVYIASNGCNRRLLDAERLERYFRANGWLITDSPKNADYKLFFASALNRVRIDESFDIISRLAGFPGETIVLGCLMEVAPYEFSQRWDGKAIAVKDMDAIDQVFSDFSVKYRDIPLSNTPMPSRNIYKTVSPSEFIKQRLSLAISPARLGDKVYSYFNREKKENYQSTFIWVSAGCPNKCSFCAERKVVGDLVSRPMNDIVNEYRKLLEAGKRSFEFIGDDVGSYGLDTGTHLPDLISRLSEADKGYQVNWVIKHLHPKFVIKYQKDLIQVAKDGKVKEIICCFQSGSNRLLELMNRQHTIEQVIDTLTDIRKVLPEIKLATNIIVGFPTETEEEFDQTLQVFDKVYFDRVHMIKYYDAEGSDSHTLEPKVSGEAIKARIARAKHFLKKRNIYFQTRD